MLATGLAVDDLEEVALLATAGFFLIQEVKLVVFEHFKEGFSRNRRQLLLGIAREIQAQEARVGQL